MSSLNDKRRINNKRFADVATMGEIVFHARDLANLWQIHNLQTLYKTLSRYKTQGLIFRIHKGLYSLTDPKKIDPYLLGIKAVHGPAYISCESVLFDAGIINQKPHQIFLVSNISRRFRAGGTTFRSRKLHDRFLHNDIGIEKHGSIRFATVSRAVADMLHFNPRVHFDAIGLIDWSEVRRIANSLGYNISIPT